MQSHFFQHCYHKAVFSYSTTGWRLTATECGKVVVHSSQPYFACCSFYPVQAEGGSSEPNELPLNLPLVCVC